jgi:hypothetical protein
MVGLTGEYLLILFRDVDLQQVTVLAVPGGFRLATQTEGATKEGRHWVKMRKTPQLGKLMVIVWT